MENNEILIWSGGSLEGESVAKVPSVSICFDRETGIIDRAEITEVTGLAGTFVMDLLVGYDLNAGPDELLDRLEEQYYGNGKQAVEDAVRGIFDTYSQIRRDGAKGAVSK